jgi:hypothetical protein
MKLHLEIYYGVTTQISGVAQDEDGEHLEIHVD